MFSARALLAEPGGGLLPMALVLFSIALVSMLAQYYFLQAAYIDLGAYPLLKNSLLLTLAYFPRSLAGFALGSCLVLVQGVINLNYYFFIMPLTVLVGYALPGLFCLSFIWQPVDRTFAIEETLCSRCSVTADTERVVNS